MRAKAKPAMNRSCMQGSNHSEEPVMKMGIAVAVVRVKAYSWECISAVMCKTIADAKIYIALPQKTKLHRERFSRRPEHYPTYCYIRHAGPFEYPLD